MQFSRKVQRCVLLGLLLSLSTDCSNVRKLRVFVYESAIENTNIKPTYHHSECQSSCSSRVETYIGRVGKKLISFLNNPCPCIEQLGIVSKPKLRMNV